MGKTKIKKATDKLFMPSILKRSGFRPGQLGTLFEEDNFISESSRNFYEMIATDRKFKPINIFEGKSPFEQPTGAQRLFSSELEAEVGKSFTDRLLESNEVKLVSKIKRKKASYKKQLITAGYSKTKAESKASKKFPSLKQIRNKLKNEDPLNYKQEYNRTVKKLMIEYKLEKAPK
jgi:hypothetical protein